MAITKGFATKAALRKAATIGTPVLCGAGHGMQLISESIATTAELVPQDGLFGSVQQRAGDKGTILHAGSIVTPACYEYLLPWGLFFGSSPTPVRQVNRTVTDGSITSSQTALTSATAAFTAADVGRRITVSGAGASGGLLDTTVATFTSATVVQLTASASTTVSSGATITIYDAAYKHPLSVAQDADGVFATFAHDWQEEVHEYPAAWMDTFSFEITPGGQENRGKVTWGLILDTLNRNTGSGTNNTSTFASVTAPTNRTRALWQELVVRLNDQDGVALSSSHNVAVSSLKIDGMRNRKADMITTARGRYIDAALQDGWTTFNLTLGFDKYSADNKTYLTSMLEKGALKGSVTLTGTTADGATPYSWTFYFNALQVPDGSRPSIGGPGLTPWTLNLEAHEVATAPTGFTSGYTDGCRLDLVNTTATAVLA